MMPILAESLKLNQQNKARGLLSLPNLMNAMKRPDIKDLTSKISDSIKINRNIKDMVKTKHRLFDQGKISRNDIKWIEKSFTEVLDGAFVEGNFTLDRSDIYFTNMIKYMENAISDKVLEVKDYLSKCSKVLSNDVIEDVKEYLSNSSAFLEALNYKISELHTNLSESGDTDSPILAPVTSLDVVNTIKYPATFKLSEVIIDRYLTPAAISSTLIAYMDQSLVKNQMKDKDISVYTFLSGFSHQSNQKELLNARSQLDTLSDNLESLVSNYDDSKIDHLDNVLSSLSGSLNVIRTHANVVDGLKTNIYNCTEEY